MVEIATDNSKVKAEALIRDVLNPLTKPEPLRSYTMFYRHGMNPKCEKSFLFNGDVRAARARADIHCRIMGYTLTFVRPMIVDLDEEEKQQLGYNAAHVDHVPGISPGMPVGLK